MENYSPSSLPPEPIAQSRMHQSAIHNYNTTSDQHSPSQSLIRESRHSALEYHQTLCIQTLGNESSPESYRSNLSNRSQTELMELMSKKESQLRNLQAFLLKQFEQINENKQRQQRIKTGVKKLNDFLSDIKKQYESSRTQIQEQLQKIRQHSIQAMTQLSVSFLQESKSTTQTYIDQISKLQSVINEQQSTISRLKQEIIECQGRIGEQNQTITSHEEKIKQQSEDMNRLQLEIEQKQAKNKLAEKQTNLERQRQNSQDEIKRQESQSDLEVSFSANRREKQLMNVIFSNIRSNESLISKEINSNNQQQEGEENNSIAGDFQLVNHLKQSSESDRNYDYAKNNNQQNISGEQNDQSLHSDYIQSSDVHRVNTTNNDALSTINKLDVFSEFNYQGNTSMDNRSETVEGAEGDNMSEMEFRRIKKQKISRSMRNEQRQQYRDTKDLETSMAKTNQFMKMNIKKSIQEKNSKPIPPLQTSKLKQQPAGNSINLVSVDIEQEDQSPSTRRKRLHRYDYCKLYEEQQLKEIETINVVCNNIILNDSINSISRKPSSIPGKTTASITDYNHVIDKRPHISPGKREISPRKIYPSQTLGQTHKYSVLQHSHRYVGKNEELYPTFSKGNSSKKPLTIQIPVTPMNQKRSTQLECITEVSQSQSDSRSQHNPYYKLEKHLHQMSYQEFSPERMRREKTETLYEGRDVVLNRNKGYHNPSNENSYSKYDNHHNKLIEDKPSAFNRQKENIEDDFPNIDRKEYIKAKIEHIKRKNQTNNQLGLSSKSPLKISFLRSEQQENTPSKHQLERQTVKSRSKTKSSYKQEPQNNVKGYDYTEDKYRKQIAERNKNDKRPTLNTNDRGKSSMTNLNNTYDKGKGSMTNLNNTNDRGKNSMTNLNQTRDFSRPSLKNDRSQPLTREFIDHQQTGNICEQLNSRYEKGSEMEDSYGVVSNKSKRQLYQPIQRKSPLKGGSSPPPRQLSPSPLKQTNKHTNSLYLNAEAQFRQQKSSTKKQSSSMVSDYNYRQEKYSQQNLHRHPYVNEKKVAHYKVRKEDKNENGPWIDNTAFRRF